MKKTKDSGAEESLNWEFFLNPLLVGAGAFAGLLIAMIAFCFWCLAIVFGG